MAAQSGMTVCAVIHQPRTSVFALFDDLILLGRTSAKFGGRTVYCGPTGRAVEYFEGLGYAFPPKENPADVFIDIVSGTHSDFRPVSSPLEAAVAPLAPLQGGTGTPPGPSDRKVLGGGGGGGGGGRRGAAGLRSPRLNLADAWAVNAERHAAAMALRIGGNPAEMTGAGAGGGGGGGGGGGEKERASTVQFKPLFGRSDFNDDSGGGGAASGDEDEDDDDDDDDDDDGGGAGRASSSSARAGRAMTDVVALEAARALRTMESAMTQLGVRLKDHEGRRTPGSARQLRLFVERQAVQVPATPRSFR